jgi:hypothetical protein
VIAGWRTLAIVCVAVGFKLWMTAGIRILPFSAPHDDSNFVEHAASIMAGEWFGHYDQLTLIKQPFFPIYLATLGRAGLSLPIAHVLLDAAVAIVACRAVRPLVSSPAMLFTIFVALFFDPFSYDANAWRAQRSQINPELALLSVCCAFAMVLRSRRPTRELLPWSLGLGGAFAAFWLTREEAAWLLPALLVLAAAFIARQRATLRTLAIPRIALAVLPVAVAVAAAGAIMLVNRHAYGWGTTNERQAPEFVSAFNALTRIDVPKIRFNQLPGLARRLAYRVSPAARELQPAFEGTIGAQWHGMSAAPCGPDPAVCSPLDVGDGFAAWAFRDAVAAAGYYTSGDAARHYYVRLAREVDAACNARAIPCRSALQNAAPIELADAPDVAAHFLTGLTELGALSSLSFQPLAIGSPPSSLRAVYVRVAGSVAAGDADAANAEATAGYRIARAVGSAYRPLVFVLLIVSSLCFFLRLARTLARRRGTAARREALLLFASSAASVLVLLLLLAAIDTLSFPAFAAEYVSQMVPLVVFAGLVGLASEAPVVLRLLRRHLPA